MISAKAILLLVLIQLIAVAVLVACYDQQVVPTTTSTQPTVTDTTTTPPLTTTTTVPPGVPGSTLLPENAPPAAHFIGGGACSICHGFPPKHEGQILNEFQCDRCHVQSSTDLPEGDPLESKLPQ